MTVFSQTPDHRSSPEQPPVTVSARVVTSKLSLSGAARELREQSQPDTIVIPVQEENTSDVRQMLDFFTGEMMAVHDELIKRTHALEQANRRLQEIDLLKTRFVSDVAHELRAPLASIMVKLDLIDRDAPENRDRHVSEVRRQVRRLGQMIESILDLTRIYMSNPADHFAPVDLNLLAEQVLEHQLETAVAAGLELTWSPHEPLPHVLGDYAHLERVLQNLIGNAVKYTRQGSVALSTTWDESAQRVVFAVADTGIGIAPEDLPRLFTRFYRGRRAEEAGIPGSGLGLAIVKEIVEQHGGGIEVESEIGVGSVFRVLLPPLR